MSQDFETELMQFMTDVMDDSKALLWLSKFDPETVTPFLTSYYMFRTCWVNFGEIHLKNKENYLTAHLNEAEEALQLIQQKKLFDLQCQWRAEQIQVPGVAHSMQFIQLGHDIQSLDFLPPITQAEFDLLKAWFLDPASAEPEVFTDGLQAYYNFEMDRREGKRQHFPKFYQFMDAQFGKTPLWQVLKDIRGEKEYQYLKKGLAAENAAEAEEEGLPSLLENEAYISEFAKVYEDRITNERRVAMEQSAEISERALMNALNLLKESKEPYPIDANADWRQAIISAAAKLQRHRLVSALDVAWENYQFRVQNGIGFSTKERSPKDALLIQRCDEYGKIILEARQLLGEPADFCF